MFVRHSVASVHKIANCIANNINTRQGPQQLQKNLNLDDATFGSIDWDSFGIASKSFAKTNYSQAHFSKQTGRQWFTEVQAHKYE